MIFMIGAVLILSGLILGIRLAKSVEAQILDENTHQERSGFVTTIQNSISPINKIDFGDLENAYGTISPSTSAALVQEVRYSFKDASWKDLKGGLWVSNTRQLDDEQSADGGKVVEISEWRRKVG
jgi:hypothetical protein